MRPDLQSVSVPGEEDERASRGAPARQRNARRPCLSRRPSRRSCAFEGRAGCCGRWWGGAFLLLGAAPALLGFGGGGGWGGVGGGGGGGGEYEGIRAQGVVVMTMTWVWTDGVQLMMNNYARFFFP